MASYYVNSNAGALEYSKKVWSVGEFMVPTEADVTTNHLVAKGWIWECTTGGTSSATPTWPASVTDNVTTVTEAGGVVWTARLPDNWTHALPGLYWIGVSTSVVPVATDIIYVAHNHVSKIYVNNNTIVLGKAKVVSVTSGTTTPEYGAKERVNAARSLQLNNEGISGFLFECGTLTTSASSIGFGGINYLANSLIVLNNTNASSTINFGAGDTSVPNTFTLENCGFWFKAGGQHLQASGASKKTFENCYIHASSTTVTALLNFFGRGCGEVAAIGCDFSNCTNLIDLTNSADEPWFAKFSNCKVPASITTGTHFGVGSGVIELQACSSADHNYDYYYQDGSGVIQDSQSVYLTTSPSQIKDVDGTLVSYSLECNPDAAITNTFPLCSPWSAIFVGSTGSKTVSMKVAYDSATLLKDSECWIEVEYYGDATTPKSTIEGSFPVVSGTISRDIIAAGSNLSDTSEGWTGTGGWANKKTHTLSKTVTINQQGYVRARVVIAKDQTIYADMTVGIA